MSEKALPAARHESSDVAGSVIWGGFALLLTTLIGLGWLVFWLFPGSGTDRTINLPLPRYPDPQLQTDPASDMAEFRAQELRVLATTGWVDRKRGVVHIPIDDAMREVARDGISGWPVVAR